MPAPLFRAANTRHGDESLARPRQSLNGWCWGSDYDPAGNRLTLRHHGGGVTASYAYDSRERCSSIAKDGATLAEYTWLGNAVSKRETTCDYPGSTKPKFKSDYQRDGLLRVTKLVNEHLTSDQSGSTYGDLGTWDYAYDSASNELSSDQTGTIGSSVLTADAFYDYDTAPPVCHGRALRYGVITTVPWGARAAPHPVRVRAAERRAGTRRPA